MIDLGTAHLTALDLPPEHLVVEAARVGFRSVGLRLHPASPGGICYPSVAGTEAHRALRRLLRDEGVGVHEVEFIELTPDVDVAGFAWMLEAGADLGAVAVSVSGDDPDPARLTAHFAALCDLAAGFGLWVDIEFMRWRVVGTVGQAAAVVAGAARPNGAVLIDPLHLRRSGGSPADVAALPSGYVRSVQLCDAPLAGPESDADAIAEARTNRLPCGEGQLSLLELLRGLPAGVCLASELPMPGLDARGRLARAYAADRRLLAAAGIDAPG